MPITPACKINWNARPKCPKCGVAVVPTGKQQPYAIDSAGRVYCRQHGHIIEPAYKQQLKAYKDMRNAQKEIRDMLFSRHQLPTQNEMDQIRKEWQ